MQRLLWGTFWTAWLTTDRFRPTGRIGRISVAAALALLFAAQAHASFHLIEITEVFTGLGGDTSVQYLELRTTAAGQNLLAGQRIVARNGDGSAESIVFTFPENFGSGAAGETILIATPAFEALAGISPDFIFDGGLSPGSGQIDLFPGVLSSDALSYGAYSGPGAVGSTGLAPAIPGDSTLALRLVNLGAGARGDDSVNYELLPNEPMNFAGETGSLGPPPATGPTLVLMEDFTMPGEAQGWTDFRIGGAITRLYDRSVNPTVSGLCIFTPLAGVNAAVWESPREKSIELVPNSAYRVRFTMWTDQPIGGAQPVWNILIDNLNPATGQILFGSERWFFANTGFANAISDASAVFDAWIVPNPVTTDAWNGLVDPANSPFDPSNAAAAEMNIKFRVLDVAGFPGAETEDTGTLCLRSVTVDRFALDQLVADPTPLWGSATSLPREVTAIAVSASGANFVTPATVIDDDDDAGTMTIELDEPAAAGPGQDEKGVGRAFVQFEDARFSETSNLRFFPVAWNDGELLRLTSEIRATSPASSNPVDVIALGWQTATNELGGFDFSFRGAPGGLMDRAASPRDDSARNSSYTSYFFTHRSTTVDLGALPGANRLRGILDFFNRTDLAGGLPPGVLSDPLQIRSMAIHRITSITGVEFDPNATPTPTPTPLPSPTPGPTPPGDNEAVATLAGAGAFPDSGFLPLGADIGDIDRDGYLDLVVAIFAGGLDATGGLLNRVYMNRFDDDMPVDFFGSGVNDLINRIGEAPPASSPAVSILIEIDQSNRLSPDTFRWSFRIGATTFPQASGVQITGSAQTLASIDPRAPRGVRIQFGSTNGHVLGDRWSFSIRNQRKFVDVTFGADGTPGNFDDKIVPPSRDNSRDVKLADFDGDGDLDMFVSNASNANPNPIVGERGGLNRLYVNTLNSSGDFQFIEVSREVLPGLLDRGWEEFLPVGFESEDIDRLRSQRDDSTRVAIADIDSDGDLDIVIGEFVGITDEALTRVAVDNDPGALGDEGNDRYDNDVDLTNSVSSPLRFVERILINYNLSAGQALPNQVLAGDKRRQTGFGFAFVDETLGADSLFGDGEVLAALEPEDDPMATPTPTPDPDVPTPLPTPTPLFSEVFQGVLVPTANTDRVPPALPAFNTIDPTTGQERGFRNSPMGYHSFMPRLGPMYHDGGLDLLSVRAFTDDTTLIPFHRAQSAFYQNLDLFGRAGLGSPPDGAPDGYFAAFNYGLDFHSRNGSGLFPIRQGEEDLLGNPGILQIEVQPLLIGLPDGVPGDFQGSEIPELDRIQIVQRGAFAGVIEDWEYRGAPKPLIVSDETSLGPNDPHGFGRAVVYRPFETGDFSWSDGGARRNQNGLLTGFGTMFLEQENGLRNDLIDLERRDPAGPMIIARDIVQTGLIGETRDAAVLDFDHDGDFDLVLAQTVLGGFNTLGGLKIDDDPVQNHILLNDGRNAVFTDVSDFAFNPNIPNQSFAVVTGDIDNDGDEDIIFFNAFEPPQLFLNGLYTRAPDVTSTADAPMFYDQTPRFLPPFFDVAIGPGVTGSPRNNATVSVAAADFNGDGRPDLATADGGLLSLGGWPQVLFHTGVLRNDGSKIYKPIGATYPPPIVVRPSPLNPFPSSSIMRPPGGEVSHGFLDDDFRGPGFYFDVSTGDFNSDGWPDLFFTRNGDGVSLYLNFDSNDPAMTELSRGVFRTYTSHPDDDWENVINPAVFEPGEDTNHNGISDDSFIPDGIFINSVELSLVLQDSGFTDPVNDGPPVILPFNGQVFDPGKNQNQFHTKRLHRRMATADFDFNGALDVVIANGIDGGGAPNVLLMNEIVVFREGISGGIVVIPRIAAPIFRDETENLLPTYGGIGLLDNTYAVAAADFDHDGDIDIIFANQGDAPDGSPVINTFRFLRNRLISPPGQPQGEVGFDEVSGVIPPLNRPGRFRPRDIIVGDFDGLGVDTLNEDLNGNGLLDPGEDSNLNGLLDIDRNEDENGNGFLDQGEDANNDGQLGIGEDLNGNGILDPGEDLDGDGRLDIAEDLNGNGVLDTAINEDVNGNGQLDPAEDLNGNGIIDVFSEDLNGNGILEILNEDLNNNGILDLNLNEDLNSNGELDVDEDVIRNGVLDSDFNEDLNGNGELDINEDWNRNGILDLNVSEDINRNGIFDEGEDFNGDGIFQVLVDEDVNHNFIQDPGEVWTGLNGRPQLLNEDTNGNGILDPGEDLNGDGILQAGVSEDLNGNGVLDTLTEDLNGDGVVDIPGEDWNRNGFPDFFIRTEDLNGDGILNDGIEGPLINEDLNGDGVLSTVDEDLNGNGILDTSLSEDLNGNNILDAAVVEDVNGNGVIDLTSEDVNGNGILDPTEDLNGNGFLDTRLNEDIDGDGRLDFNEDINNNGVLDGPEDLNGNGVLDLAVPSWDLYITFEDGPDALLLNNNPASPGELRFIDASDRLPVSSGLLPSRGGRAGDVNGDGLMDIVIAKGTTDSATAPVQLFINTRNGQGQAGFFFDATHEIPPPVSIRTTEEFDQGVADLMGNGNDLELLDVDGDGDLDIYVGLLGAPITFQQTGSLNVLYVNRSIPSNFNQPRKSVFDRGESVSPIVTRRAIEGSAGNVAVVAAEPGVVFPGRDFTVAIRGANFSPDTQFDMGVGIVVNKVEFVSPSLVRAEVRVSREAPSGPRPIVAKSPGSGAVAKSKNGALWVGSSAGDVSKHDWRLFDE